MEQTIRQRAKGVLTVHAISPTVGRVLPCLSDVKNMLDVPYQMASIGMMNGLFPIAIPIYLLGTETRVRTIGR